LGQPPGRSLTPRAVAARKLGLISQKTKLAEAIRYAVSRWEELTLFVGDGGIELLEAPLP
jgi:hypothetical protein